MIALKIGKLELNTTIIWTPIFQQYLVMDGYKDRSHKKTHLNLKRLDYVLKIC